MLSRMVVSLVSVGTIALCADIACGQNYPNKVIRIVTAGVGGGSDYTARIIAPGISGPLGQPVIVENRGGGVIPGEVVSRSPPDGYTILVTTNVHWVGPVTTAEPSLLYPGVPTVAASGLPGYDVATIYGMWAAAKTPEAIIHRLNQEIVRVLNRPEVKEKFFNSGVETVGSTPAEFAATVNSQMAKMGKVIKDAGIRAD